MPGSFLPPPIWPEYEPNSKIKQDSVMPGSFLPPPIWPEYEPNSKITVLAIIWIIV